MRVLQQFNEETPLILMSHLLSEIVDASVIAGAIGYFIEEGAHLGESSILDQGAETGLAKDGLHAQPIGKRGVIANGFLRVSC